MIPFASCHLVEILRMVDPNRNKQLFQNKLSFNTFENLKLQTLDSTIPEHLIQLSD